MEISRCRMPSFAVIGKEGSTNDGEGFIPKLWQEANAHFVEIQPLAEKDEQGNLLGFWGAMSDFSRSFQPWEYGFQKGLYLAGVQCQVHQEAPEGWTKWIVPAYEYLYVQCDEADVFMKTLDWMEKNELSLVGAVHDFTCPKTGKNYMFFPIRRL